MSFRHWYGMHINEIFQEGRGGGGVGIDFIWNLHLSWSHCDVWAAGRGAPPSSCSAGFISRITWNTFNSQPVDGKNLILLLLSQYSGVGKGIRLVYPVAGKTKQKVLECDTAPRFLLWTLRYFASQNMNILQQSSSSLTCSGGVRSLSWLIHGALLQIPPASMINRGSGTVCCVQAIWNNLPPKLEETQS